MSSLMRLREEEVESTGIEGLQDGGHVVLSCSNCKSQLMDIWVTRPREDDVYKVRAMCCFCGDKSFIKKFKGGFHVGGIAKPKRGDDDNDIQITVVDRFDIVDGTIVFYIEKAGPDVRPIYGTD